MALLNMHMLGAGYILYYLSKRKTKIAAFWYHITKRGGSKCNNLNDQIFAWLQDGFYAWCCGNVVYRNTFGILKSKDFFQDEEYEISSDEPYYD
jgi:hypothetical protein